MQLYIALERFTDFEILIVGRDREDHIVRAIESSSALIILKLHGDVTSGCYAFTRREIFQFNATVEPILTDLLTRDVIFVGHGMRDFDLLRCVRREGGKIWCVNPLRPRHLLATAMDCRDSADCFVHDLYGRFDNFFSTIEGCLP